MPPSWHPVPAEHHDYAAGGQFFFAATKIRIGRGIRCRYGRSRRNYSSLPLRRLESDAERCGGRDRCRSGGFVLRIMPPSWHPVPACSQRLCCRRAIHRCSNDGAASIPKSRLEIKNRCTQQGINRQNPASIPKSSPEIKNRCTQQGINRQNLASILKFTP